MAGVLGAECVAPAECPYSRVAGCDVLGIGSGIYYGRPHDELLQWVRDLPEEHAPDFPIFIFTTSGLPFLAKLWHRPLRKSLAEKGFEVVGETLLAASSLIRSAIVVEKRLLLGLFTWVAWRPLIKPEGTLGFTNIY